jgi:hypothetical protein
VGHERRIDDAGPVARRRLPHRHLDDARVPRQHGVVDLGRRVAGNQPRLAISRRGKRSQSIPGASAGSCDPMYGIRSFCRSGICSGVPTSAQTV